MVNGGYVYILTTIKNTVLYIGVTSDLRSRLNQHLENHFPESFTSKYNVKKLVYFECFYSIEEAIYREKQLKSRNRKDKVRLIEKSNPDWVSLNESIEDFN